MSVVLEVVKGSFADYKRVGQEEPTNSFCQTWKGFVGCMDGVKHDLVTLNGVNYKGKGYVHPIYVSCNKPSCRLCYKKGWAVHEARKVAGRFVGANASIKPDHVVVSPSEKDYGVSVPLLMKKARKAAEARGVNGGVIIYHQERFKRRRGWYFSPHFHFIAYIDGGYKCRGCAKGVHPSKLVCGDCCGFEARTRRLNEKDGFIVAIAKDKKTGVRGERKDVFGSAYYQLHHSSYRVSAKRHNVAVWFGTCSYRRLKVKVEKTHPVCPICGSGLKRLDYTGNDPEILRLKCRRMRSEDRDVITDICQGGVPVWEEIVEEVPAYMVRRAEYGSGSSSHDWD